MTATGVFNAKCRENGEDVDIHVSNIDGIEKGKRIYYKLDYTKIKLCIVLVIISIFFIGTYHKLMRA